jgi:hypothetical protein
VVKHEHIMVAAGQKDGQITNGLASTVMQDFGHPYDVVGISLEMQEGGGWIYVLTVERMKTVDGEDGTHSKVLHQVIEAGPDGVMRGARYKEHYLVRSLFIDAVRRRDAEGNPD